MKTDHIIHQLQDIEGRSLAPEEIEQIEDWNNGRLLDAVQNHPGYAIVMQMIEDYVQGAVRQALTVKPGENDRVIAAHAVAFTMSDFYVKLQEDIRRAISVSRQTPEIVKSGLRAAPGTTADSL